MAIQTHYVRVSVICMAYGRVRVTRISVSCTLGLGYGYVVSYQVVSRNTWCFTQHLFNSEVLVGVCALLSALLIIIIIIYSISLCYHVTDASTRNPEDWRPNNAFLPSVHGDVRRPVLSGAVRAKPGDDACTSAVLPYPRRICTTHSAAAAAFWWYQQYQYQN